jgi:hypothetical protein
MVKLYPIETEQDVYLQQGTGDCLLACLSNYVQKTIFFNDEDDPENLDNLFSCLPAVVKNARDTYSECFENTSTSDLDIINSLELYDQTGHFDIEFLKFFLLKRKIKFNFYADNNVDNFYPEHENLFNDENYDGTIVLYNKRLKTREKVPHYIYVKPYNNKWSKYDSNTKIGLCRLKFEKILSSSSTIPPTAYVVIYKN